MDCVKKVIHVLAIFVAKFQVLESTLSDTFDKNSLVHCILACPSSLVYPMGPCVGSGHCPFGYTCSSNSWCCPSKFVLWLNMIIVSHMYIHFKHVQTTCSPLVSAWMVYALMGLSALILFVAKFLVTTNLPTVSPTVMTNLNKILACPNSLTTPAGPCVGNSLCPQEYYCTIDNWCCSSDSFMNR